jgi:preprotein translocase subunit SecF
MEIFKRTNFDFLGKKWPFIGASLVLTVAGLGTMAMKGGPSYGIDFKGGALLYLRFNQEPPVQKIRSALESKVKGEISVQQITGRQEVLVGTEIRDEKELNANRQIIEDTLRSTFGAQDGKLDLNNSSSDQLANRLRDPLLQAPVGDVLETHLAHERNQHRIPVVLRRLDARVGGFHRAAVPTEDVHLPVRVEARLEEVEHLPRRP